MHLDAGGDAEANLDPVAVLVSAQLVPGPVDLVAEVGPCDHAHGILGVRRRPDDEAGHAVPPDAAQGEAAVGVGGRLEQGGERVAFEEAFIQQPERCFVVGAAAVEFQKLIQVIRPGGVDRFQADVRAGDRFALQVEDAAGDRHVFRQAQRIVAVRAERRQLHPVAAVLGRRGRTAVIRGRRRQLERRRL